jgi:hypothetical protein
LRKAQLAERKRIRSRINRLYRYVPKDMLGIPTPACVDYRQVLDALMDKK